MENIPISKHDLKDKFLNKCMLWYCEEMGNGENKEYI